MRRILIVSLIISIAHLLNAQEEKSFSKILIGGSTSFSIQNNTYPFSVLSIDSGIGGIYSNNTNDSKNVLFGFSPYVGKEMNERIILGVQFDFGFGKYSTVNQYFQIGGPLGGPIITEQFERNSNQIGFGIFMRYILNPNQQIRMFLQPYIEYNILNEEVFIDSDLDREEKANYINVGLGGGVLYEFNDRLRATLRSGGLSYINGSWEILETETNRDFNTFQANFRLTSVSLGLELKF